MSPPEEQASVLDLSALPPRAGWRPDAHSRLRRWLVVADVIAIAAAFVFSEFVFGESGKTDAVNPGVQIALLFLIVPAWVLFARLLRLYDRDVRRSTHSTSDELLSVIQLTTMGTWLVWASAWLTGAFDPGMPKLMTCWVAATGLIVIGRTFVRRRFYGSSASREPVAILGTGRVGQEVARKISAHRGYGLELVCFADDDPGELDEELRHVPIVHPSELVKLARRGALSRVTVAYTLRRDGELIDLIHDLRLLGVHMDVVPRLFEFCGQDAELNQVEGLTMLTLRPIGRGKELRVKRAIDLLVASAILIVCSPVLLLVALLVRLDSPGPVFYRSRRIGRGGVPFDVFKFRTMRRDADDLLAQLMQDELIRLEFERTHKVRDDPRVTRLGGWLRKRSIDELPQLLNVLRGELSLVGPRPITAYEFELLSDAAGDGAWSGISGYWQIDGLKPGLTGVWQINGRSIIPYQERVRMDKMYAANWSVAEDIRILSKTIAAIVGSDGAH